MSEMNVKDDRFTFQKADDSASEHISAPKYSYWKSVFRQFFRSKLAITLLVVVIVVVLLSIFQPMFSGYSPMKTPNINNQAMKYIRPNSTYWFGTDDKGNSLFDAVWAGTRNSLIVSFSATAITVLVGVIVGMWWGFSKRVDAVMIQVYNVLANIPTTLIAMVLVYALGSGMGSLIFALSITSWVSVAYFIRVQVMIIRDREYNLASRCLGTSTWTMITKNILPYLVSVIMTEISRDIPSFISYEVFLSYLGVGLGRQYASLGQMIRDYSPYLVSTPYLFWIPVTISAVISVSLYIVGQTLADASDPRTHMI